MVSKKTYRKSKKDKKRSRIETRSKQKTLKKKMYLGKKEQKELRYKLWGKSQNIKRGGNLPVLHINPYTTGEQLVNSSYLSTTNNIA